jgi:hypothetical protein
MSNIRKTLNERYQSWLEAKAILSQKSLSELRLRRIG